MTEKKAKWALCIQQYMEVIKNVWKCYLKKATVQMLRSALASTADHPCVWFSKKSKYNYSILKLFITLLVFYLTFFFFKKMWGFLALFLPTRELAELNRKYKDGVWSCWRLLGEAWSLKGTPVEHNCRFCALKRPYRHTSVFWEHALML